jgi:hypothetical protein
MEPYATIADLSAFWRPVTAGQETERATALLVLASNRLRGKAVEYGFNMDIKTTADAVYKSNVQFVVLESVKRAMQTDQNVPPVDSYQKAAGPYSENYKFTNPSGDLWFKGSELAEIGLSGEQAIFSLTPKTTSNFYGEDPEVVA